MKYTQKAILDAARRFAGEGLINSGALVQFHPAALAIEVVAPSAANHVAPAYPLAAEAPRLYGRYSVADACDAWLDWMADVLGVHYRYRVEYFQKRQAGRRAVAKAIVEKLEELNGKKVKPLVRVTREEWNAKHPDYKRYIDGQPYMLQLDRETGATVLVPVEIV